MKTKRTYTIRVFEGGKCYSFAYYIGLNDDHKNELCFNWLDYTKKYLLI